VAAAFVHASPCGKGVAQPFDCRFGKGVEEQAVEAAFGLPPGAMRGQVVARGKDDAALLGAVMLAAAPP
jgi:hypothetical protein